MASKIHILHIIKTLNISGAERFAIDLASSLDQDRFEVQVCSFFEDKSPIEQYWHQQLNAKNIRTWFAADWHGLNHYSSYLQGMRQLERHLREWPADIINTHFQLGTLAALYCRKRKLTKRVIRTAQNHRRKEWSNGWYGWIRYQLISGWLYPMACDVEVGVSAAILSELKSSPGARFARSEPKLIPNAIPTNLVQRAESYPRVNHKAGGYVVGSIGRLMPQKGYVYLLQAIPQVCDALPGTEFWLIGDGEMRSSLEELAHRLHIEDSVRFLGRQVDVLQWLRQMDLFVLPSLWEGFSLVIMESMAAGVPVIATNIAGTRDLIQDGLNGCLVLPADSSALARKITALLKDEALRSRLAEKAFDSLESVKMSRIKAQYEALYQESLYGGTSQVRQ